MKIRLICKLPSEILGVGYALAGILVVGALVLGVQFTIVNYGAAVMDFMVKNAITIGFVILFLVWAIPSWAIENDLKAASHEDRLVAMIIGTIIAIVMAAVLAYDDKTGVDIRLMEFLFVFQLVSMLVGWLGHWCKRCIRIEPDGKTQAGGENL